MPANVPDSTRGPARSAIALGIAAVFCLGMAPVFAAAETWTVNSCDDDPSSGDLDAKTGTLRFAAKNAPTGSTFDLTTLACSTISLTTGSIKLNQDDITINGPAGSTVTISGKQNMQTALITHNGYGTLTLNNLDLYYTNNTHVGYVHGGCVYSYGSIVLDHVRVTHCSAKSSGSAVGGAVFAHDDLTLKSSTIAFNEANGDSFARAGGAYAKKHMHVEYSTIDHNTVYSSTGSPQGEAGGLFAPGLVMKHSTVSNNHSHGDGGGFGVVRGGMSGDYLKMYSSTVSGNSADHWVGAGYVTAPVAILYNSTIASNTSRLGNRFVAPGLVLASLFSSMTVTLQSTLMSDNTVEIPDPNGDGSTEYDLGAEVQYAITFNGIPANNFIRRTMVADIPSDTLRSTCPLLGPLRDNGGPTQTQALLSGSAAINKGNNLLGVAQDQRGVDGDPGPPFAYARESDGVADVGAYEFQKLDVIFATSAEGCVDIPAPP